MAEKTDIPEEIQEYYQTERRERTGVAWLLAFGTLIATVVLGAGIFFGGRWAYREIAGTDESTPPAEIAQNDNEAESAEKARGTSQDTDQAEQSQSDNQDDAVAQSNEEPAGGDPNAVGGTSDVADDSGSEDSNSTPSTGAVEDDDLPNTGPGSTVAIFLSVSILGYLLHRLRYRARLI